MRTRSRRIHWSTRRLLLAACLCGPTFALPDSFGIGAEEPTNQFRIVTSPAKPSSIGQVQLASDGWAPRQSTETVEANTSTVVRSGNEEQVGSGVADSSDKPGSKPASDVATSGSPLDLNEPKSTLNFIIPSIKRADEKPAAPVTEKPQTVVNDSPKTTQPSARLASELYGPGSQPSLPSRACPRSYPRGDLQRQ